MDAQPGEQAAIRAMPKGGNNRTHLIKHDWFTAQHILKIGTVAIHAKQPRMGVTSPSQPVRIIQGVVAGILWGQLICQHSVYHQTAGSYLPK
ncbi:MAG: hypothetical protein P1U83_01480 [Roseovarius sp.]|nr:hypothetical protein [Roseovarius sp.]